MWELSSPHLIVMWLAFTAHLLFHFTKLCILSCIWLYFRRIWFEPLFWKISKRKETNKQISNKNFSPVTKQNWFEDLSFVIICMETCLLTVKLFLNIIKQFTSVDRIQMYSRWCRCVFVICFLLYGARRFDIVNRYASTEKLMLCHVGGRAGGEEKASCELFLMKIK